MIRRIVDALRRGLTDRAPERQFRPNELRREVVRAERLEKEARQEDAGVRASRLVPVEERGSRARVPTAPDASATTNRALTSVLTSRSGLRQAWVVKEVLGPPIALRGSQDEVKTMRLPDALEYLRSYSAASNL